MFTRRSQYPIRMVLSNLTAVIALSPPGNICNDVLKSSSHSVLCSPEKAPPELQSTDKRFLPAPNPFPPKVKKWSTGIFKIQFSPVEKAKPSGPFEYT